MYFFYIYQVWDLFYDAESVRQQLSEKIKVESLRTYLFTYSSIYDSVSLVKLAQMHDLPVSIVHSTVSKMIINEELAVSTVLARVASRSTCFEPCF